MDQPWQIDRPSFAITPIHDPVAVEERGEDTVAMATQPIGDRLVSVEEYLSTGYDPDCEYDDGVVVERNLGEFEHSFLQILLGTLFTVSMDNWGVFGLTEQRVQIKPRRFLVPDVCVLRLGSPREKILTRPPLIAIEIMSPEDTIRRASAKAIEYLEFGVEHVWVIDPSARVAYSGTRSGLQLIPSGELSVPETPIIVRVSELFEKLDRM
jgi:Uma2 family endonuclease